MVDYILQETEEIKDRVSNEGNKKETKNKWISENFYKLPELKAGNKIEKKSKAFLYDM